MRICPNCDFAGVGKKLKPTVLSETSGLVVFFCYSPDNVNLEIK